MKFSSLKIILIFNLAITNLYAAGEIESANSQDIAKFDEIQISNVNRSKKSKFAEKVKAFVSNNKKTISYVLGAVTIFGLAGLYYKYNDTINRTIKKVAQHVNGHKLDYLYIICLIAQRITKW